MKQKLVLFDFDGTLTRKDTLLLFILYTQGIWRTVAGFILLSPFLVSWKLGLLNNHAAKQRVLQYFFGGQKLTSFNEQCIAFASRNLSKLIRTNAIALIEQFKRENARIVVVSASPENWVKPWCDIWNIECIATKLEVQKDVLTGKIDGLNCYGKQKEARVREAINLADYSIVVAYGDTRGDKEMLAMASEAHYREV